MIIILRTLPLISLPVALSLFLYGTSLFPVALCDMFSALSSSSNCATKVWLRAPPLKYSKKQCYLMHYIRFYDSDNDSILFGAKSLFECLPSDITELMLEWFSSTCTKVFLMVH